MGSGNAKNSSRYGGYNNPNVYNDRNNKKITYDWKPMYDSQSSRTEQAGQGNQGSQTNQGSQSAQGMRSTQGSQSVQEYRITQGRNAAGSPSGNIARTSSGQSVTRGTTPAAANARPSPAQVNARASSATANPRPSAAPAGAMPFSSVAFDVKPSSEEANSNRKRNTGVSAGKDPQKEKEAGAIAVSDVADVQVFELMLGQDEVLPEYKFFEYSTDSYDMPESGAFRFSDVVVDSEVRVDAVIPDLKDNVKLDVKE